MTSLEFTNQVQKISYSLKPVAMNLTRDADDAKDLVQETLLKALLNKDKFKAGTNLKAWLYTIMRNTFINNYNKITKRNSNIDSTAYFLHLLVILQLYALVLRHLHHALHYFVHATPRVPRA